MAVGRLGSVSLDCADPQQLAAFWAELLGGTIAFDSPDFVAVTVPGGPWLTAVRTADHRPAGFPDGNVAKQIHLDLSVGDLDEAQELAVRAGAQVASSQPSPERWRVLIDPAGHPFCLTTGIPD